VLCYELAEAYAPIFARADPSAGRTRWAARVLKAMHFAVAHEVGHALIDRLKLPVLGREEDAADQFALWYITTSPDDDYEYRLGKVSSFSYALLALSTGETRRGSAYADVHSLAVQRVSNLTCWMSGYARTLGLSADAMEEVLPADRRAGCVREYLALSNTWGRLLNAYVAR